LAFPGHERYEAYYRELDIERAVAKTTYRVNGVTFTREALVSFPDQVMVVRLAADKPGQLSFTAFNTTLHKQAEKGTTPARELILAGRASDHEGIAGAVKFKVITRVKTEGGSVTANDTSLTVRDATTATVFISIATNFKGY